ncbi:uncharacterized protein A4U43_C05F29950 [Asparagus officinalis]|uniref:Uncharacterized protein n=1 Tax=Asparagus officinalis TaxID=4686 RepID=A0A5P1EVY2_ASPOF|nr:uncharacterized protein A4U43_C05F29950 [Asparagus officinalis]
MAIPIIGHLHLLGLIPHQALHKLSLCYGPLISIRLGSHLCVVASSPETAKEFLKTHELSFSDKPPSKVASYLTYGSADFAFAPYSSYWRYMKKLTMTQLLGGQTLEQLLPVRRQEIIRLMKKLFEISEKGEDINMSAELSKLTNNVICRMAMSRTCTKNDFEAEEARKIVEEMTELAGKFNLADFVGFCKNLDFQGFDKRLEDLLKRFDKMMEGIMKEKQEERQKERDTSQEIAKDLLDIMLDIASDDDAEMKLTRENIKAFIQRRHRRRLESQIRLEILGDLPNESLERELPDQKLGAFLVLSDLSESDGAGAEPVRAVSRAAVAPSDLRAAFVCAACFLRLAAGGFLRFASVLAIF